MADPGSTTLTPYLAQIGEVDLLTAEEEVDLSKRAQAGVSARRLLPTSRGHTRARLLRIVDEGRRATDRLVRANLRLVVSTAQRYRGRGLDLPDLIQEGNLGLLKAVERFDHARGFRFSTYATWWIRQAITRGIADRGRALRVPVHVHETLVKLRWVELDLWQRLEREPTEQELADRMGLRLERLREIRAAGGVATSLDAPLGADGAQTLGAVLADGDAADPERATAAEDARRVVETAMRRLDERERFVLERRYGLAGGEPRTLDEVGRELGVTRERIRQIEKRALRRLATQRLDDLLGVVST